MEVVYSHYASALLSLAKEEKKVLEYKLSLLDIEEYFSEHNEVKTYLESYFVETSDKYEIIDLLTKDSKLDSLSSFLKLLIKKHRFNILHRIVKEYVEIANEELGILEGYVYSVNELTKKEIGRIEEAIGNKLTHKVELKNKIDKSLIGGFKVIVSDHVYDSSLKSKLQSLKLNLKERRN